MSVCVPCRSNTRMAKITVDVELLETRKVDNRGRVYLGREYIGEELEIAIISRDANGEDE